MKKIKQDKFKKLFILKYNKGKLFILVETNYVCFLVYINNIKIKGFREKSNQKILFIFKYILTFKKECWIK